MHAHTWIISPAYGWLIIFLEVVLTVVGYDAWAKLTHNHTLSRQMHDWAFHPAIGQFIIAGGVGFLAWFIYHISTYHAPGVP